jgi:hypothetical protein
LLAEGKIDSIIGPEQNKIVFASTAYYQFNHFWDRVQGFQEILVNKIEKNKQRKEKGEEIPEEDKVTCMGASPNKGQVRNRIMMDKDRALIFFNFEDPPDGFMNTTSIDEAKREMSEYMFLMEYCCYFPADSDGFFPRSLLDKAREHREYSCLLQGEREGRVNIMGIDPARSSDNFVIAIMSVDLKGKDIRLERILAYHNKNFPSMHSEIRRLVNLYNIAEIGMDAGGGGTTIRDLLANKDLCPMGEDLILQRDFEEHRFMKGKRMLELIQFSKYEIIHDGNHNLLSGLQHGDFTIAAPPPCGNEKLTPERELADEEIERTLDEMQNIIVKVTPAAGRMHWDTPMKHHKKDRYSAVLVAHIMAHGYLESANKPIKLASGFWG